MQDKNRRRKMENNQNVNKYVNNDRKIGRWEI